MDQKRELTSIDLAALVGELNEYGGAKVDKAYLYGDDFLRLKLRDFDRGRVELLIEVGDVKRAHVAVPEHVPDAPGRPPDFAKMLRNRLSGADFASVSQYEFDRILRFEFEREDGNTTIIAELFGEGNVAACDETRHVIDSLETIRLKSRTVAPGSRYQFPDSRVNPLEVDEEGFVALMRESDTDLVRTLATQLNLGGLYAEEVCTRAGVEKTVAIEDASDEQFDRLYDALSRLAAEVREKRFDPRVYRDEDELVDVTPIALEEHADLESSSYDRFNEALDDYFFELDTTEDEETDTSPEFDEEIERKKRIIDQQEGAIEGFERQAAEERERAELVYANYGTVDEVLTTIRNALEEGRSWDEIEATFERGKEEGIEAAERVSGFDPENGMVTVDLGEATASLEVRSGVEKNADRLYTEAKRIEEKKAGAEEAIAETREELETLRERKRRWEEGDAGDGETDADDEPAEIDWLSRASIPVRKSEEWYEDFRWFHTSDGFLVIGGRNADQNEALVKKYLDRGDRFFHTQAHGGPVTVLKATGPSEPAKEVEFPESSIHEAAQFAVSYSSVWKEGRFADDAYSVTPDQVSKTPESGEYIEKGGFVIRGDRTYHRDVEVGVAVGITCEPTTRVIGGPPSAIVPRAETAVEVEPGRYAQNDMAKMLYREFRERFADTSFVRKVASPDLIQEFLPAGGSRMVEE
ncbi:ribosome rescue protein RqcH [Halalkalicoccus sp. NIPERK01]|uniref:ribosome rescue protein RqcH n=1 Tax=Halalkalicoccus sp. NIPERK01 TaxID=3053469 RepID=UPI00256F4C64|nr:ribosome rescue protein RqcH [Halalkalicoccus sp. NIPERK01]MDL5361288.1 ribosome rescue protein RqcH [Halalkalicoccus sp. NIPERK01]